MAQDMFATSDGITMSSDIPSDMVNTETGRVFRELKLDGDSLNRLIIFACYNLIYTLYIKQKSTEECDRSKLDVVYLYGFLTGYAISPF